MAINPTLKPAFHGLVEMIKEDLDPDTEFIEVDDDTLYITVPVGRFYHSTKIFRPRHEGTSGWHPKKIFLEGARFLTLYRLWRGAGTKGLPESMIQRNVITQGVLDAAGTTCQELLDLLCPEIPSFDQEWSTRGMLPKHLANGNNREARHWDFKTPPDLNWVYGSLRENKLSIDTFTIHHDNDLVVRCDPAARSIEIKLTSNLPEIVLQRLKGAPLSDFIEHPALNPVKATIRSINQQGDRTTIRAVSKHNFPLAHAAAFKTDESLEKAFLNALPALDALVALDHRRGLHQD